MKNFLTLLLVCSLTEIRAQVITYDYHLRKHTPEINAVQHGSMISYRIVNINPFAEKVTINGKAVSMTTDVPAQLAALFSIKAEAAKELKNTGDQVAKMNDVQKSAAAGTPLKEKTKELVESCNAYYREAQKIDDVLDVQERLMAAMADKRFYNEQAMRQALTSRGIDTASIAQLRTNYTAFRAAYNNVYYQYGAAAKAANDASDKDKEARIASAQEQVENDFGALKKQYEKTLTSVDDLFAKATNPDSYVVMSLPLKLSGTAGDADEVDFRIEIGEEGFTDTFNAQGGLKVDYSVGPVFNFITNDQYFFDVTNTLRQRTRPGLLNTITPSVAAMMHVYRRSCTNLAIGGMFGINATFNELTDINLGFLAGASAVLGRSQKVIVSTGVSYANVNRLKEGQYSIGTRYDPAPNIADVTERTLRPSWFVAVSLALAKRRVLKPLE